MAQTTKCTSQDGRHKRAITVVISNIQGGSANFSYWAQCEFCGEQSKTTRKTGDSINLEELKFTKIY